MNTNSTPKTTTIIHINTPWRHPNGKLIPQGVELFESPWLGKKKVFSSEVEVITNNGDESWLNELFDQMYHRKAGFQQILSEARLVIPRFIFVIEKISNGIALEKKKVIEEREDVLFLEDEWLTPSGYDCKIEAKLHGVIWFNVGESIPSYDTLLENYAAYITGL